MLFVRRPKTREEEEEIEKQKYEEQVTELEDFVGFTKVLRMIVNSVSVYVWVCSIFSLKNYEKNTNGKTVFNGLSLCSFIFLKKL